MLAPTFDVRQEDPCSLALTLRLVRRLRGIKQAHAGEFLGVTQSTVSRIERGELKPAGALRNRLLDLVVARIDPSRDAALRHLVEDSASPVHLVCDCTHRPLAASGPREREWRRGERIAGPVSTACSPSCSTTRSGAAPERTMTWTKRASARWPAVLPKARLRFGARPSRSLKTLCVGAGSGRHPEPDGRGNAPFGQGSLERAIGAWPSQWLSFDEIKR